MLELQKAFIGKCKNILLNITYILKVYVKTLEGYYKKMQNYIAKDYLYIKNLC